MEVTLAKRETLVHTDHEVIFEEAFKSNFKALHAYSYTMLQDEGMAEEIVQTVFLKLWESRDRMTIHTSLRAYLYKSVYNESLNYLKHKKVQRRYMEEAMVAHKQQQTEETEADNELQRQLQRALRQLPEKCRTVFQLSRFEELKYQEIAERLGISLKTVEAHMGKALKLLRIQLADFLPLLLIVLPNLWGYG
ncbi:RNA polymerase sigma-70 factor [Parapedobacter indicus]|uniref:RNA polymerase sigma-70 factor, ECF subfamily n=1 Tax=Parapedobacter indicus TaxID=1477437 RepID=A0A1I3M6M9_9SPHI|nr:RNA polymerase sigma-70 factor [Parapedobacter indicus]PPL01261.1 RNA polymerase sigma-70 factor (ECF subfamily) [Parapedobacter indicus]SFI92694.1 RNA polymerase sigma-70 factor, ECF subfamily [Parapedobacter indicus]